MAHIPRCPKRERADYYHRRSPARPPLDRCAQAPLGLTARAVHHSGNTNRSSATSRGVVKDRSTSPRTRTRTEFPKPASASACLGRSDRLDAPDRGQHHCILRRDRLQPVARHKTPDRTRYHNFLTDEPTWILHQVIDAYSKYKALLSERNVTIRRLGESKISSSQVRYRSM